MPITAKQAFAHRLVEALRDKGVVSIRNARSGVDAGPLAKAAGVSREMARRYLEGKALPDPNKLKLIAESLGVRVPWLRDGEGTKMGAHPHAASEPPSPEYISPEAIEIAKVWMRLPKDRRDSFRQLMCLEAVVAKHYPWLMFGRPRGESYDAYERRAEQDMIRLTGKLTMKAGE